MKRSFCFTTCVATLSIAGVAAGAPVTIAAGQTYTLSADLTLSGTDSLDASGTTSNPCIIVGNGHAILATNLSTHVKIQNCELQGLGGTMETSPAIELTAGDGADVTITGSTFDASGPIRLHLNGTATATFNNNLLKDNGIAYIEDELMGSMYVPAFYADGSSTGMKVFQGNRIDRDAAWFDGVSDWLVGGYGDQYSNVLVGHRGVIRVRGNHVKVVGNFINPQYQLTSPDVENLVVGSDDTAPDLVVEHNVLNSGEWVLRECQGDVRYNLIADMNGHAWIKGPHDCNVHHNIFVNYDTPDPNREAGIDAVYYTPHLNIYNNTFDGGGKVANLGVPAIHAGQGRLIERVHSNAITNFIIDSGWAAVSSTDDETQYDTNPPPGDARMHYADYNLFYNPDSPSQTDYSIKVEPDDVTPLTKGSAGFAAHDVHAAPLFKGPLPTSFPYASADVQSRTVKVSTILAHYRDLYTPGSGSPLTGKGDPMGGAHNNIGAIGQGSALDAQDQFGTFMPGTGGGPPPLNLPDAGKTGGQADGGAGTDASADATADADTDAAADGGTQSKGGKSGGGGCSCRVTAARTDGSLSGLALVLGATAVARRRRRRTATASVADRARALRCCALGLLAFAFVGSRAEDALAAPAVPSGGHPRLFMSATQIAGYKKNAATKGSAAAQLVATCQQTIDTPTDFTMRGGADGSTWPDAAMSCAFAYRVTGNAQYLTQATKYLRAALEDDQMLGDKLGCLAGVSTDFSKWNGSPPAPPVILTVTHDTGYPMRWYGPDVALAYDWLSGVTGVDTALLSQTRTCITAWSDYYTASGYHNDEPGANYNAGFIIGKTLTAIAIGNDSGADGHLWNEIVDTQFKTVLVGKGLAGLNSDGGAAPGVMVGGDWAEGWQYGPLSVLEYAVAARALEENGAAQPEMDTWTNSLIVRYLHGTVPAGDGQWVGGDFDDTAIYQQPAANEVDAVLAGPSNDTAAAWAASEKAKQSLGAGSYFYNALAELRQVTAADFTAQSPPPALWYVARGTRALYARTAWGSAAFWGVFSSAPANVSDHQHFSASNFVFTRGSDHLIVDPSTYGGYDTLSNNAITVDSDGLKGDYATTQTPWSEAELVWARGTSDAVYAARSDFAKAFAFNGTPSDIPYAHREWVMLPEGEVVTIDRVQTKDASHFMYLNLNVNSGGGGNLKLSGSTATATIGGSKVAIHAISLSGGTPTIAQPPVGDCFSLSCSYPCGICDAARFAVDKYTLKVPGPYPVAVHVIDGLGSSDAPAIVGSIGDETYDPAPKQNAGVIGAAVFRGSKQTFVVASSAHDGASPTTMTYGVPGASASRHIVFDAPENGSGQSTVTASAQNGRCVLSITAGAGFAGHPLMFGVSAAADGCKATEDTDVSPGVAPADGGVGTVPMNPQNDAGTSGGGSGSHGGCGCRAAGRGVGGYGAALVALLALAGAARRRRP